jgi:hypothetical protein
MLTLVFIYTADFSINNRTDWYLKSIMINYLELLISYACSEYKLFNAAHADGGFRAKKKRFLEDKSRNFYNRQYKDDIYI